MPASSPDRWVVVDLETTGMSPARGDRIVEIGAVALEGSTVVGEFATLVDPDRLIPYDVQRIHGISDSMVIGQPLFEAILPQFLAFCGEATLISHNASFDRGFLDAETLRATREPLPHAHVDTVRLSRMVLPRLGRHSLDSLVRHFGVRIPSHERHRALGDARATAEIWLKLRALAEEQGKNLAKGYIRARN
jgi:DNA polymerase-3 subunit alpha (Gram-positive type)